MESFRQTRHNRRTELIEDYVELIADLIEDGGEARQVDIAQRLGVAQPTVAKMLKRLAYRRLYPTAAVSRRIPDRHGKQLAEQSRERHHIVEIVPLRHRHQLSKLRGLMRKASNIM